MAEHLPFPFLGIVGQQEMKLALILSLINPNIGGSLLIGPRGTGKTTAVRSLGDLLPDVERSRCDYGCLPEDIEAGGMDAVCPDCAKHYAEGQPLTYADRVRLIELPLNSQLEDVIGGLDERASMQQRMRIERGIMSRADQNLLYIDEVNLLEDSIVDAILDAAAQGTYTVHRGPLAATYRARFILIGSMNPEEGRLRPQILDRFGLRVSIRGLDNKQDRLEAYNRSIAHRHNPRVVIAEHAAATNLALAELQAARDGLKNVTIKPQAERFALSLIEDLGIHSLRAELTLFEAARAHSIADGRLKVEIDDVQRVAPMALRMRRSSFIDEYLSLQSGEDEEIQAILRKLRTPRKKAQAVSKGSSKSGKKSR
ncbi:MAG: magnesium chelatase [Anaerolineales bacterium]|nr:MAG: magnesium chelatase [Anaerolineales bacterium]